MSGSEKLVKRLQEFNKNVWDHTIDPFQMSFDEPSRLDNETVEAIINLSNLLARNTDDNGLIEQIRNDIRRIGITYFEKLLQFCGLTRNKILTDLNSANLKVAIPSSYARLPDSDAWNLAGKYLLKWIKPILLGIAEPRDPVKVVNAINHATWSGWIRQERAKRSGHEAEGRLARIFKDVGVPFSPIEKAENPLCPDAQLYDVSFDLIVPNTSDPKVCVKSTVHTANIGQYGESKDYLEIDEATRMLASKFSPDKRPVLLAFIDGVGFHSNRAGLEGVLTKADEFCQFKTAWKAVVLAESKVVIPDLKLFLHEDALKQFQEFLIAHHWDKSRLLQNPPSVNAVVAGEGIFQVGTPPKKPESMITYLVRKTDFFS